MTTDSPLDKQITKTRFASYKNLLKFFRNYELDKIFKYNLFSSEIEIIEKFPWDARMRVPKIFDDDDIVLIKDFIVEKENIEFSKDRISDAIIKFSKDKKYHPVIDYLDNLKWDGVKRLETWLINHCNCHDNIYTRYVSQLILISAVARVYDPGCKFDYMVIMEGLQGCGKSTLVNLLGRKWGRTISLMDADKETIERMQGSWIVEVAELACFK